MKRTILAAAATVTLLFAASRPAAAQIQAVGVGPKAGFGLDKGTFMIGGIAEFPINANLDFQPGIEFLPNPNPKTTRLVIDADGRYTFLLQGLTLRPFVLAGLGLSKDFYSFAGGSSSDLEFRINFGGGVVFNTRSLIQPWVGLKGFILADNNDIFLEGGVNFYL
jgi:hypothetical protein